MVNYAKLRATAQRLIEANGRTVTLRKDDETPDGDAWRGPDDEPTPPDGDVLTPKVVFVPPRGSGLGAIVQIDPSLFQRYEKVAIVAAASVEDAGLEDFSTLVDSDGRTWRISSVERLQPGDVALLFTLGLNS